MRHQPDRIGASSGNSRRRDGRRCRPATSFAASGAARPGRPARRCGTRSARGSGRSAGWGISARPAARPAPDRSSAEAPSATASRCTGVGRSPALRARHAAASTRRSARGVLRHHLVVGRDTPRHALQHLAERRPAPARLRREIRAAPERRAVRSEEHGQRPAALLAQRVQRRHVEVVDVRPFLAVHLDVDEQRRSSAPRCPGPRTIRAPSRGTSGRRRSRSTAGSACLLARASSSAAAPQGRQCTGIVGVLQQIGRGLVAEQVCGLGHGVALLLVSG